MESKTASKIKLLSVICSPKNVKLGCWEGMKNPEGLHSGSGRAIVILMKAQHRYHTYHFIGIRLSPGLVTIHMLPLFRGLESRHSMPII